MGRDSDNDLEALFSLGARIPSLDRIELHIAEMLTSSWMIIWCDNRLGYSSLLTLRDAGDVVSLYEGGSTDTPADSVTICTGIGYSKAEPRLSKFEPISQRSGKGKLLRT